MPTPAEFLTVLDGEGIHLFLREGQLHYRAAAGKLNPQRRVEIRSRRDELIAELARQASPTESTDRLPVGAGQRGMILTYANQKRAQSSHVWAIYHLEGDLDVEALVASIRALRERHAVLRSHFGQEPSTVEGEPPVLWSKVESDPSLAMERLDLRETADPWGEARRLALDGIEARFDLWSGSLMRGSLLRVASCDHVLVLVMHHAIIDGISLDVAHGDLVSLYLALSSGRAPSLPRVRKTFWDYVEWRERMAESGRDAYTSYWRARLSGVERAFWLPPRQSSTVTESLTSPFALNVEISGDTLVALRDLARSERTTMTVVAAAAYCCMLASWSGQTSTLVWMVDTGRRHPEMQSVIGCLIDLWILCTDIQQWRTFVETVRQVRDVYIESLDHLQLPGFASARELRDIQGGDLRPGTMFNYLFRKTGPVSAFAARPQGVPPGSGLRVSSLDWSPLAREVDDKSRIGLNTRFIETDDTLRWASQAPRGLFEEGALERFGINLQHFFVEVARDPAVPIGTVGLTQAW